MLNREICTKPLWNVFRVLDIIELAKPYILGILVGIVLSRTITIGFWAGARILAKTKHARVAAASQVIIMEE